MSLNIVHSLLSRSLPLQPSPPRVPPSHFLSPTTFQSLSLHPSETLLGFTPCGEYLTTINATLTHYHFYAVNYTQPKQVCGKRGRERGACVLTEDSDDCSSTTSSITSSITSRGLTPLSLNESAPSPPPSSNAPPRTPPTPPNPRYLTINPTSPALTLPCIATPCLAALAHHSSIDDWIRPLHNNVAMYPTTLILDHSGETRQEHAATYMSERVKRAGSDTLSTNSPSKPQISSPSPP